MCCFSLRWIVRFDDPLPSPTAPAFQRGLCQGGRETLRHRRTLTCMIYNMRRPLPPASLLPGSRVGSGVGYQQCTSVPLQHLVFVYVMGFVLFRDASQSNFARSGKLGPPSPSTPPTHTHPAPCPSPHVCILCRRTITSAFSSPHTLQCGWNCMPWALAQLPIYTPTPFSVPHPTPHHPTPLSDCRGCLAFFAQELA